MQTVKNKGIMALADKIWANSFYPVEVSNVFRISSVEEAEKVTKTGKEIMNHLKRKLQMCYNKKSEELESYFDAAELAGLAMGLEPISKEDYDRFWKWMMVPLKDVPDDELIWCSKQDRQNSIMSKGNWLCEIKRRGLKID